MRERSRAWTCGIIVVAGAALGCGNSGSSTSGSSGSGGGGTAGTGGSGGTTSTGGSSTSTSMGGSTSSSGGQGGGGTSTSTTSTGTGTPSGCPGTLADCNGTCVDTQVDPANCGACNLLCAQGEVCSNGECALQCGGGTIKCGGSCIDVNVDPSHCGNCDTKCPDDQVCAAGTCALECVGDTTKCGRSCVNVQVDPAHCGMCNAACMPGANATAYCAMGQCGSFCNAGFADCDMSAGNGCEANLASDPANCQACGNACPSVANGSAACMAGKCAVGACSPGFSDCNKNLADGCEANTQTDNQNCGACGMACGAGANCVQGQCMAKPCTQTLNRVWGAADNDIYAVGNGGLIVHFNGAVWTPMNSSSTKDFLGIHGTSASDIWAVGVSVLSHWDGQAWTSSEPGGPAGICTTRYDVWGANPSDYHAGHCGGYFIRYTGAQWVSESVGGPQKTGIGGCAANDIWGTDEALGWITHFDGNAWQLLINPNGIPQVGRYGVACLAANDVFMVGINGDAVHYNGTTWQEEATGTSATLREVAAAGAKGVVAVGDGGKMVQRKAGVWSNVPSGTAANLRGVWVTSTGVAWVVGDSCTLLPISLP